MSKNHYSIYELFQAAAYKVAVSQISYMVGLC